MSMTGPISRTFLKTSKPAAIATINGTIQMMEMRVRFWIFARGKSCVRSSSFFCGFKNFILPNHARVKARRSENCQDDHRRKSDNARTGNDRGKSAKPNQCHQHRQQKNIEHRPWADLANRFINPGTCLLPPATTIHDEKKQSKQ